MEHPTRQTRQQEQAIDINKQKSGFHPSHPNIQEQIRILRSFEISVIRRTDTSFEARNGKNGHTYRLQRVGSKVLCPCPDSQKGNHCKHQIAAERVIEYFDDSFSFSEVVV